MLDILVVGAGFAGSVIAERFASSGKSVLVIDKRPHIGGNALDEFDESGVLIHRYGPHIFHTNSSVVEEYLSRFTEWRPYEHRVLSCVGGKLFPMPINRTTINEYYGLNLGEDEVEAFLETVRESRAPIRNSEDLVLNSVGRELCDKFFRNYTRKQWNLDLSELSPAVAGRIPVRTNSDDRYFTDSFQKMPAEGFTRMFERLLDHANIRVELGVSFEEIKQKIMAKMTFHSGPIDAYFDFCYGRPPYRSLRFQTGRLAGLERTARLIGRIFKHIRRNDGTELRALTYEFPWRRLFWSKERRLRAWELETQNLFPGFHGSHLRRRRDQASPAGRSKISVCMATYNGEQYVEAQLRSILDQLDGQDEVIIVDDASTDRTCDIIWSFKDARIRLIEHQRNSGVVTTVEDAVRNATGDIIFLADQDDIWAENKVAMVLAAFHKHSEAMIVTSRITTIDENGSLSPDSVYNKGRSFRSGFWRNILHNYFQGSAMAFRSELLHMILPFPKRVEFLHDYWIGTRSAILGMPVIYIDEPLLLYRRHAQNCSKKLAFAKQAKVRLQLLWTHLLRYPVRGKDWRRV